MERIEQLREQAAILRALANSFDVQAFRDQLLDVVARATSWRSRWRKTRAALISGRTNFRPISTRCAAALSLRALDQSCALFQFARVGEQRGGNGVVSGEVRHSKALPRLIA
jgi:hypothetical protein